jgi:hypothetical protein
MRKSGSAYGKTIFRPRRETKSSIGPSSSGIPELTDVSCTSSTSDEILWDLSIEKYNTSKHPEGSVLRSSIRWLKSNLALIDRKVRRNIRRTSSDETTELSFWTSQSAKHIYTIFLLGIIVRQPILFYGVLVILLRNISYVCSSWWGYYAQDQKARLALRSLRTFWRRLVQEGEKAASGDYSRLVAAGYILYNCTAPGESYISYTIRYRMSMINQQIIEELSDWRERRHGYEKSKRDLFA